MSVRIPHTDVIVDKRLDYVIRTINHGFPERPQLLTVESSGTGTPGEVAAFALALLDSARQAGWTP